jgi:two-component system cell cycle response regulator CtrA
MKILIIEDDLLFVKKMEEFLEKNSIETNHSGTLEEALLKLKNKIYDCILLDLNLPDVNGKELIATLRRKKDYTPIIVLSACTEILKKTEVLDMGADDYINKPCHGSELLSRIKAVTRRANHKTAENIIQVGQLALDLRRRMVTIKGIDFPTTESEYKIIQLMVRNKGNIVSKKNIMNYLYNHEDKIPHKKILDVFFCKLRKKIAEIVGPNEIYIETSWGSGYKLCDIPVVNNITIFPEENFNSLEKNSIKSNEN